ncbi:putative uncharacterized protein [Clostridium sp. CAG:1024]|nr:putative uncharacterized protein [Clostridium sp. CAG:1024]
MVHRVRKRVARCGVLIDHDSVALFLEIFCVQDLIAAACGQRKRHEHRGLCERKKLKNRIRARTGKHDVGKREQVGHLLGDEFILNIAVAPYAVVALAAPAQMYDIVYREQAGGGGPPAARRATQQLVQRGRAGASAFDEQNGLFAGQPRKGKRAFAAALVQLRPDGRAGKDGRAVADTAHRVLKRDADRIHEPLRDPVRKARRIIGFVRDDMDMRASRSHDHRNGDKAALAEHNVRLERFQKRPRLPDAL